MNSNDKKELYTLYLENTRGRNPIVNRFGFRRFLKQFEAYSQALESVTKTNNITMTSKEKYNFYMKMKDNISAEEMNKFNTTPNLIEKKEIIGQVLVKELSISPDSNEAYDLIGKSHEKTVMRVKNLESLYHERREGLLNLGMKKSRAEIWELYDKYSEVMYDEYMDSPFLSQDAYRPETLEEFRQYLLMDESEFLNEEDKEKCRDVKSIAALEMGMMTSVYSLNELETSEELIKKDSELGLLHRMMSDYNLYYDHTYYCEHRDEYRQLGDEWDRNDFENYEKIKTNLANFKPGTEQEEKLIHLFQSISTLSMDDVIKNRVALKDIMDDGIFAYEGLIRTQLLDNVYEVDKNIVQENTVKIGDKELRFNGIVINSVKDFKPLLLHSVNYWPKDFRDSKIQSLFFENLTKEILNLEDARKIMPSVERELLKDSMKEENWLGLMSGSDFNLDFFLESDDVKREGYFEQMLNENPDNEFLQNIRKYYYDPQIKSSVLKFREMIKDPAVVHGTTEEKPICTRVMTMNAIMSEGSGDGKFGLLFDKNGIQDPESIIVISERNLESNSGGYDLAGQDFRDSSRTSASFGMLNTNNSEIDLLREQVKPSGIFYIINTPHIHEEDFIEAYEMANKNDIPFVLLDGMSIRKELQMQKEATKNKSTELDK